VASAEPVSARPTLAVFASDRGPGDPERASIMSLAGGLIARHGARIVCLEHDNDLPIPLITAARAAGGEVLIVGDAVAHLPGALAGLPIERIADPEERLRRVSALAQAFVGLPGSLASTGDLYRCWVRAGSGASGKPVVLLNRNRAFEVLRGLSADILSHSVKRHDRLTVFTDNIDDLWNRISWALSEAGPTAA